MATSLDPSAGGFCLVWGKNIREKKKGSGVRNKAGQECWLGRGQKQAEQRLQSEDVGGPLGMGNLES